MLLRFNDALEEAANFAEMEQALHGLDNISEELNFLLAQEESILQGNPIQDPPPWPDFRIRLIRDVYGKLRYAINCDSENYPAERRNNLESKLVELGNFASDDTILFRDDLGNPDLVFNSPDWHQTTVKETIGDDGNVTKTSAFLLDRQIIGQDWLNAIKRKSDKPHRIVFFGLKGGVGRSTALAMTARHLSKQGKRVLLLDFDLESPGLSSLLLPSENIVRFGLIDWFVEDAVGQADEELLDEMVSNSPLTMGNGRIRVAAAMGKDEAEYLAKLARVYVDVPAREYLYPDLPQEEYTHSSQRFADRMQYLIAKLEQQEQADVVLIDSRAGLHDISAIALTSVADTALLFATDGAQSWNGYRQLFKHWQQHPAVCRHVRKRLAIVQALAPQNDREVRSQRFRQKAYELFASTLYDSAPDEELNAESGRFSPEMDQQYAPHFPIRIGWSSNLQEFDPMLREEAGGVLESEIETSFGALFSWLDQRLNLRDEDEHE